MTLYLMELSNNKKVYSGYQKSNSTTIQQLHFFRDHPNPKIIRPLKLGEDLFFLFFRDLPNPKITRALELGEDFFLFIFFSRPP